MREAVYLSMTGVVSSIDAAFEMDGVMRSAAVIVAKQIEETRRQDMVRAFATAVGVR